jgi:hypothetical protein
MSSPRSLHAAPGHQAQCRICASIIHEFLTRGAQLHASPPAFGPARHAVVPNAAPEDRHRSLRYRCKNDLHLSGDPIMLLSCQEEPSWVRSLRRCARGGCVLPAGIRARRRLRSSPGPGSGPAMPETIDAPRVTSPDYGIVTALGRDDTSATAVSAARSSRTPKDAGHRRRDVPGHIRRSRRQGGRVSGSIRKQRPSSSSALTSSSAMALQRDPAVSPVIPGTRRA